ncbi:LuxR family transcriptional regulator [Amycolatopsis antarctica]|uniref:LuxR family transcriptional regulator n=1 Tax=Amycolatopsis antarctica TaxID=1854586 RepID=A0A263CYN4_9PSEU|nr:response regulator [Amycolatopsis antarctica]OZM71221.1 LuxR family transcriptional regulator [Amycolatopsis antarctica]
MTTVALVDDHPAVLMGITTWCADADPCINVVASGTGTDTAWTEHGISADVVVFDPMSDRHVPALNDLRRLAEAGRRVVVYSMRKDHALALACLDIGAYTYLSKVEGNEHLVPAIHAAANDLCYPAPALADAGGADINRPSLTPREFDALVSWFHCESKDAVAERIGVSTSTVNTYLDRVRIKYANAGREASTKATLLVRAVQDGLINFDDL